MALDLNLLVLSLQHVDGGKEPTLTGLENILANQEALDKQMSKVSVKEVDEAALFSNKRVYEGQEKRDTRQYNRISKEAQYIEDGRKISTWGSLS